MYGFQVTLEDRVGTVVSEPIAYTMGLQVAVLWDDHSFSSVSINDLSAVPIPKEGKVLNMVKPEDVH